MMQNILMVTLMGWLLAGPILAQQVPALVDIGIMPPSPG